MKVFQIQRRPSEWKYSNFQVDYTNSTRKYSKLKDHHNAGIPNFKLFTQIQLENIPNSKIIRIQVFQIQRYQNTSIPNSKIIRMQVFQSQRSSQCKYSKFKDHHNASIPRFKLFTQIQQESIPNLTKTKLITQIQNSKVFKRHEKI